MNKRIAAAAAAAAMFTVLALTGCGQRAGQTPVQPATEPKPEVITEAVTEPMTQAPTETVKEDLFPVETETETETETEPELMTEPAAELPNLSESEEEEKESEFTGSRILYAGDDINVRSTPSTESSDNIFASYDQGEEVTVTGETPSWYVVTKDDMKGYVHKDNLSETAVEPKSPEERDGSSGAAGNSNATQTDIDYNVTTFAESYTVETASAVNLRSEPSQDSETIGTIPADTIVTAYGKTDKWYKVEYDGTVGYINGNLVK